MQELRVPVPVPGGSLTSVAVSADRRTVDLGSADPYVTVSGDGALALASNDRRTTRFVSLAEGPPADA